ncbi:MAG: hypothetical protein D6722_21920 [Bacteroidetes bacterium]|nr:MAG: hypothetical protein D6722_21920 [Bacteroidota bacterium]
MNKYVWLASAMLLLVGMPVALAQEDTTSWEEEDWSMYDDLGFADEGTKRFCSSKITGLSPAQFISLGWDLQGPYSAAFSPIGTYQPGDAVEEEAANVNLTHGLRLTANVPVLSRNDVIIQLGANIWDVRYQFENADDLENPVAQAIAENGLRTMGLNTTIFKPLNEKHFLLFQGSADLNGDYTFGDFQSLSYLRYSAAALFGWRPNDNLQWGVGLARTYRVGELNYIPVVLYNWTSTNRKWGTEILFPARAHVRRTFNARSLLMFGYELEGQSYRINSVSEGLNDQSLEIRRGEMRWRLMWQRQLVGFIWLSAQAGYRINWSFDADALPEGQEFFRGFFGDQPFAMLNRLGNPFYANVSVNFVSP